MILLALLKDIILFIWEISAEQELLSGWFFVEKLPPVAVGRCYKPSPLPGRNLLNIISYHEIMVSLLQNDYHSIVIPYTVCGVFHDKLIIALDQIHPCFKMISFSRVRRALLILSLLGAAALTVSQ